MFLLRFVTEEGEDEGESLRSDIGQGIKRERLKRINIQHHQGAMSQFNDRPQEFAVSRRKNFSASPQNTRLTNADR
jgi:hypothetical protein